MRTVLLPLLLGGAVACGGNDDGDNGNNGRIDAGANPDPDAEVNTCVDLDPSYGDLGTITGTAFLIPQDEKDPTGLKYVSASIDLNTTAPIDVLFIELWEDAAPYSPALATGTVTIEGMQAEIINCGACVFISPDHDDNSDIDFHMASSGTLNVDMIDPTPTTGRLMGTLSGANLREVSLAGDAQSDVPGGCRTSVDAVAFDFTVETEPPAARRLRPRRPRPSR